MSGKIAIKEYPQGQTVLFPERMNARIAAGFPVRLISTIADQSDTSAVMDADHGGRCSSYSPRMLLKVLFCGYLNGLYSCRKTARAMEENIHYMWLSGKQFPRYNTINNFRSLHLKNTVSGLADFFIGKLPSIRNISLTAYMGFSIIQVNLPFSVHLLKLIKFLYLKNVIFAMGRTLGRRPVCLYRPSSF